MTHPHQESSWEENCRAVAYKVSIGEFGVDELKEFAEQTRADAVAEFKSQPADKIIEAVREDAVREERERIAAKILERFPAYKDTGKAECDLECGEMAGYNKARATLMDLLGLTDTKE